VKTIIANDVEAIRKLIKEINIEGEAFRQHEEDVIRGQQAMRNSHDKICAAKEKLNDLLSKIGLMGDKAPCGDWEETFKEFCIMLEKIVSLSTEKEMRRGE